MKSHSSLRLLAFLPLTVACSADAPPPRGNGNNGGSAGITSNGGNANGTSGGASPSSGGRGIVVGNSGNAGAPAMETCGITVHDLVRKPADVLLVLDRSASMKEKPAGGMEPKWDLVIPAVTEVIASTNTSVSWGMKSFPEGDRAGECTATSVTSKIDVPIAPNNAAAVNAQIMATNDEGDGTPTSDAIKAAVTYLKGVDDGNPKYILLATDGEPSCDGTTKGTDVARTAAVSAIQVAFDGGIPTYVVGVDTSKSSAKATLNNMAIAGGRAIGGTNPEAAHFYLASDKQGLVDSLTAITGEVNKSCVFNLDPRPPAPDFILVQIEDKDAAKFTTVSRDPARLQGWEYTAANYTSLEVYGTACDAIKNAADKVVIKYGCLGVVPK